MKKLSLILAIIPLFSLLMSAQTTGKRIINSTDLLNENLFPDKGMEGPAIDKNGNLYAVSYLRKGTIGIVNINKATVELFVTLPEGSTGNGIRFDKDGFMIVADYTGHNVFKIDPATRKIAVLCHNPAMNQPNDLSINKINGYIYLSDPNWDKNNGNIWVVYPDGKSKLLESGMGTTNGVEVSPDGKKLYVNESNQRNLWVYDLNKDGIPSGKRLLCSFTDFGMDGMRCDSKGNIYLTRYGAGKVLKISPEGKILKEYILKGETCTNITLSADEKTGYVTMQDRGCFEVIKL